MQQSFRVTAVALAIAACRAAPAQPAVEEPGGRAGPSAPPAVKKTAAAAEAPGYVRMKKAQVTDEHGFERPMAALSLLLPAGWKLEGGVRWGQTGAEELVRVGFRATAPDGVTSIELSPAHAWQWADSQLARHSMELANQSARQFGGRVSVLRPPLSAREFLRKVAVPQLRPGARLVGIEPIPDVDKPLREQVRRAQAQAAQAGLQLRLSAGHARARLAYLAQGTPVEEWLTAVTNVRAMPMPSFDPQTGQLAQTIFYQCSAELIFGLRAPQGRLEDSEKLFTLILSTLRVEPDWQARVLQVQQNISQVEVQGARDRSRIIAKSADEIGRMQKDAYERRQRSQDRQHEQFSQLIRGVETYRNPGTGEEVELSSRYGNSWTNGLGEYVMSDSSSFNPNSALHGNWTQLERVKPGR